MVFARHLEFTLLHCEELRVAVVALHPLGHPMRVTIEDDLSCVAPGVFN
jgi:hypothetical protein